MNWWARRDAAMARRDNMTIGSLVYPYGAETYFTSEAGELCRRFARHPGIQACRKGLWVWV